MYAHQATHASPPGAAMVRILVTCAYGAQGHRGNALKAAKRQATDQRQNPKPVLAAVVDGEVKSVMRSARTYIHGQSFIPPGVACVRVPERR